MKFLAELRKIVEKIIEVKQTLSTCSALISSPTSLSM